MTADNDDISKLLGQIKLQDFPYRAFGRGESAPLRIVRSTAVADDLAPAAPRAAAVQAPIAVTPAAAPVEPAIAPARAARAVIQPSMRVGEAFERLARIGATASAPPLHLQLDLPKRPPFIALGAAVNPAERRLQDVFERLHQAAIPNRAKAHVGSGTKV